MEVRRCPGCMRVANNRICEYCGHDAGAQNASHQLPHGTVLKEQYLIGKVLGQGGFGITYLGWDLYLDIPVAIKEYFPQGMVMRDHSVTTTVSDCTADGGERFRNNRERFLREAKMLARFSQIPEIVQVKNFFLANNTAYIVMEYVEGIHLKHYVRKHGGKLTPAHTFRILGPIVKTMGRIHKAGIIHRDISPDNIMMQPDGTAKLLDFGAVRDVGMAQPNKNLTRSTEAIVKPGYAPIEQYQKRGTLGPWSDVYALCATIYFCLTGEAPDDAPERVLENVDLDWNIPGLTPRQQAALRSGSEIRVENRMHSMEDLYQALIVSETTSSLQAANPVSEVQKPDRHRSEHTKSAPVREPAKSRHNMPRPENAPKRQAAAVKQAVPEKRQKAPEKQERQEKRKEPFSWIAALILLLPILFAGYSAISGTTDPVDTPKIFHDTVSGSCNNFITWEIDRDNGVLTLEGGGDMPDYIGAWYDPAPEGSALAPWAEYSSEITEVVLNGEITHIGNCSFCEMPNLAKVTFPDTLQTIGEDAFWGSGIRELALPEFAAHIGNGAFAWTNLEEIDLSHVESIGQSAFDGCEQLHTVTLGANTLLSYRSAAFTNSSNTGIEGITLRVFRNSAAEDYARKFGYDVQQLQSITYEHSDMCGDDLRWYLDLETGFLRIEGTGKMWDFAGEESDSYTGRPRENAPWYWQSHRIKIVSIGDGVTELGEYAFAHCAVSEVNLGNTLEVIPFHAFLNTKLEYVDIPGSVTNIESHAFNHCHALTDVILPAHLKVLKAHTFNQCTNLQNIWIGPDTKVSDTNYTPFNQRGEEELPGDLTVYSFPESNAHRFAEKYGFKTGIGYYGMVAQDQGQIGDNVSWFVYHDHLVIFGSGETWRYNLSQADIEGWAKEPYEQGKAFMEAPGFMKYRDNIRHIQVLPGVTDLMNGLFQSMPNLRTVDLGEITACYSHFISCSNLEEVVFPETCRVVGSYLFQHCENLRKVTFLRSKVTVEDHVFGECHALEEVWFQGGETIHGYLGCGANTVFYVKKGSDGLRYAQQYNVTYEIID